MISIINCKPASAHQLAQPLLQQPGYLGHRQRQLDDPSILTEQSAKLFHRPLILDVVWSCHGDSPLFEIWHPKAITPPGKRVANFLRINGHGLMMAEGDYVMIHSRYSNPDGSAIVVVDIMRIKDGVFEEHWDVIQPEATREESKSKLPMFGDSFPR
jgi:hypothetical protein